jgi:hypothetical protein
MMTVLERHDPPALAGQRLAECPGQRCLACILAAYDGD